MPVTITIPQPPSWLNLDPIASQWARHHAFQLAHELENAPADTVTVSTLEDAREVLQHLEQRIEKASQEVKTAGCKFPLEVDDGLGFALTDYTGCASLNLAMVRYVERCTRVDVLRYHPDECLRPAVVAADLGGAS